MNATVELFALCLVQLAGIFFLLGHLVECRRAMASVVRDRATRMRVVGEESEGEVVRTPLTGRRPS